MSPDRPTVYFAYPGSLNTPTGGYRYDRRLITELCTLGLNIAKLPLPPAFPSPGSDDLDATAQALATLPDHSLVVIDGLAYGVMDPIARTEADRLKLVALCHHPLAFETGLNEAQRATFHRSERCALAQASLVIVTSRHTAGILIDEFSVPEDRIVVALPGTDPTPFATCTGQPPRLLTIASLTRRKAHDVLIAALARLRNLSWQARFVGSAEFDPEWSTMLKTRVGQLGLEDRIEFIGSVDATGPEYLDADLFVLPSRYEGYGMVFAEALAAGLPIVATAAGAVPDLLTGEESLLVPPDDVEALSKAIARLLGDHTLRRQLQERARLAAGELPTWQDTARLVANALEAVALP